MKDLRKMLKKAYESSGKMPEGHEERFLSRLKHDLPEKKIKRRYFSQARKIAASVLLLIGIGVAFYAIRETGTPRTDNPVITDTGNPDEPASRISLGDLSPDLKKVEDYYMTAINWELSRIEVDEKDKRLFKGYMDRLAELNEEYQALNRELNNVGPNEQTVTALIDNLKMRLQLLYRLKEKLQELKNKKDEERSDLQV